MREKTFNKLRVGDFAVILLFITLMSVSLAQNLYASMLGEGGVKKKRGSFIELSNTTGSNFQIAFDIGWTPSEDLEGVELDDPQEIFSFCRLANYSQVNFEIRGSKFLPKLESCKDSEIKKGNTKAVRPGRALINVIRLMDELNFGLITIEDFTFQVAKILNDESAKKLANLVLSGNPDVVAIYLDLYGKSPKGSIKFSRRMEFKLSDYRRTGFYRLSDSIQKKIRKNFSDKCQPSKAAMTELEKNYCAQILFLVNSSEIERFIYDENYPAERINDLGFQGAKSLDGKNLLSMMIMETCDNPDVGYCGVGYREPPSLKRGNYLSRLEALLKKKELINDRDKYGFYPLTDAISAGCITATRSLLASGADPNSQRGYKKWALRVGGKEVMEMILPKLTRELFFNAEYSDRMDDSAVRSIFLVKDSEKLKAAITKLAPLNPMDEFHIASGILNSQNRDLVEFGLSSGIRFVSIPGAKQPFDSPLKSFYSNRPYMKVDEKFIQYTRERLK